MSLPSWPRTLSQFGHPEIDADEIAPGLWQGSVPPVGSKLSDLGFDLLVLAAEEHQLADRYYPGVRVVRVPMDDADYIPIAKVMRTARLVAQAIRDGKRVLVTCAAGLNRSGLITALALWHLGLPGKRAVVQVRARRAGSLGNPCFTGFVARLPRP